MITGENYVGSARSAKGRKKFNTYDPEKNKRTEWEFHIATVEEVEEATRLSWEAFKEYREFSGKERSGFLSAIADEIEKLGDELLEVFCIESGLPMSRAKTERDRTLDQLRSYGAHVAKETWPETIVDTANGNNQRDLRKTFIPIGPVVVFGSSNFPLAYSTAGGDTASALAAGCTVIVKGHPFHAGTGELVAGAIIAAARKTGMPNGVFSNLHDSEYDVGKQLVLDPHVKAVGFTGSSRGGRSIYDLANTRHEPIPVFAEMGSINPVILSPAALTKKDYWIQQIIDSATKATGQFCTSPGLILSISSPELEEFISSYTEELLSRPSTCMLHPNIKSSFEQQKALIKSQKSVETIGEAEKTRGENFANQAIVSVSGNEFLKNSNLHQEVFGPFSVVVKCETEAELLQIIDEIEGQLTGTIIGEPHESQFINSIAEKLKHRAGRLIFNGVPTGVEVSPAMTHGGPYPATTDPRYTAVGVEAIKRWVRPVTFQNFPENFLPEELKK